MGIRIFTPHTARESLVAIRPTAESMCRLYRVMERRRPATLTADQPVNPAYFALVRQLTAALGELKDAGVQVKNPRTGLIDFPARREGRLVLLCWKVGESSLGFWHELEGGFTGRKPVDDDGPWSEEAPPAGKRQ